MTIDGLIWMSIGFMAGVVVGIGAGVLADWIYRIDKEAEEEESHGTSDRQ